MSYSDSEMAPRVARIAHECCELISRAAGSDVLEAKACCATAQEMLCAWETNPQLTADFQTNLAALLKKASDLAVVGDLRNPFVTCLVGSALFCLRCAIYQSTASGDPEKNKACTEVLLECALRCFDGFFQAKRRAADPQRRDGGWFCGGLLGLRNAVRHSRALRARG